MRQFKSKTSIQANDRGTHGHRPRCCRSGAVGRGEHRRYPGSLKTVIEKRVHNGIRGMKKVAPNLPGGSIEQITRSLRSSRSLQSFLGSLSFGGTTQASPSLGRQSRIPFPNGL